MGKNKKYIIAIDQGTTSCRVILYDFNFSKIDVAQENYQLITFKDGWVEADAMEIWILQERLLNQVISKINPEEIDSIGITNQRETTIVWNKKTGIPIYNAIIWQDQRTINQCHVLKKDIEFEKYVVKTTGLVIDTYFSATKIQWILENCEANTNDLCFGTIDSWLIWNLTKGKSHVTDTSNASRTMLFDIKNRCWDNKLINKFTIPADILPEVLSSDSHFGNFIYNNLEIPINSVLGDQQAALFGQQCILPGMVKNTYGTGCFMLMNIGEELIYSNNGLLTTIAWTIGDKTIYALEGSVFIAGSAIQWLRDNLNFFKNSEDSHTMALQSKVDDLFFVPAFSGLGAPYWDMNAKGVFFGITREVTKNDMTRATLEAIALRTCDIVFAMSQDANMKLKTLLVDGGASSNDFLMQFQSNMLDVEIVRPEDKESTAFGVALLAGLSTGFWSEKDLEKLKKKTQVVFLPNLDSKVRNNKYNKWLKAIKLAQQWGNE